MKALVLSAGTGTRMRPLSHAMPKQLVPVADRPVLEYVLRGIADIGVTEVGVVVGDRGAEIAERIGDGARFGLRLTYLYQDAPRGLAHCVLVARPFLGDDDFVMFLGDNVVPDGVADVAADFAADRPAAQVVVHKVPDPRSFGVAELDRYGRVLRLVEKPRHPRSDLALIGVYFFTPAIHTAVESIRPSARGELEITDAIQWLLEHGADVRASEYHGYWKDTGDPEAALECNRQLLGRLRRDIAGEVDHASRVSGEVVLAAGARVVRSAIRGPVVVGPGTLIEDSRIGPNTAIGGDCVLRDTRIADSIVLDGARIAGVAGLRGSIVGRRCTVGTGGPTQTQHRIVVGDDSRLEIVAGTRS